MNCMEKLKNRRPSEEAIKRPNILKIEYLVSLRKNQRLFKCLATHTNQSCDCIDRFINLD